MKARRSGVDTGDMAGRRVRPGVSARGTLRGRALGWFWVALLVISLAAGGCGGCGGKKKTASGPPSPPPGAIPGPQQPGPGGPPGEGMPGEGMPGEGMQPGMGPGGQPTEMPGGPGMMPPEGMPKEKPKPTRPEKLSEWKKEDYFSAKAENDPKLVEALNQFGEKFAGNAAAARMLAELLPVVEEKPEPKPKPEEKPGAKPGTKPGPGQPTMPSEGMMMPEGPYGPGMYGPGGAGPRTLRLSPEATKAAVTALVVNGTPDARKTLEELLAGKIDTGNDQAAVQAVLGGLAAAPGQENEDILFRALTAPEKYRPKEPGEKPKPRQPGPGEMPGYPYPGQQNVTTAAGIQQTALGLVKVGASSRFRERLARHLVDRSTPLVQVELLGPFLKEPHPNNLRAQLILYQAPETRPETRIKILGYFTKYSSDALGLMLGVSSGQQAGSPGQPMGYPGGGPMGPMEGPGMGMEMMPGYTPTMPGTTPGQPAGPDPDLPFRLAAELWSPEFTGFLDASLAGSDSLSKQGQFVLLAATVPTDAMRRRLHNLLQKRWEDGTQGLAQAGFPGQVVTDPGFLITVKMLPRARELSSTGGTGPMPGTGFPGERPGHTAAPRDAGNRTQAAQDWLRVSGDMVGVLCERFYTATLAEVEKARQDRRRPDFTAAMKDLPIPIRGEPEVVGAHRLDWPGEVQKKLPSVTLGPMTIHYARLRQKERLSTVLGYYRRQLRSRRSYTTSQGTWLDSSRPGRDENWQRSVDVLISRASGANQPGMQPGMELGPRPGMELGPRPGKQPGKQPGPKTSTEPEEIIIQILSIEMLDPSREPGQAGAKDETSKKKT